MVLHCPLVDSPCLGSPWFGDWELKAAGYGRVGDLPGAAPALGQLNV